MAGFADILAAVEAASPESEAYSPALRFGLDIAPPQTAGTTDPNAPLRGVIAAYQETIVERTASACATARQDESIEDFVARFPTKLSAARHSPHRLSALRREIAWALHPDRMASDAKAAEQAMAGFNAMIDAALAQCAGDR